MLTDPARQRRSDPGNPDICPVFAYHKLYSPQETVQMVNVECRRAGIGCVEDKKLMADNLVRALAPIQERRREYDRNPGAVREILEAGSHTARETAGTTMEEVRTAMNLSPAGSSQGKVPAGSQKMTENIPESKPAAGPE
jgi:tryptophanyl-tRNA synthetase